MSMFEHTSHSGILSNVLPKDSIYRKIEGRIAMIEKQN